MKCLNANCNEQVQVGNYCPAHAISAGRVLRHVDQMPMGKAYDQAEEVGSSWGDLGEDSTTRDSGDSGGDGDGWQ